VRVYVRVRVRVRVSGSGSASVCESESECESEWECEWVYAGENEMLEIRYNRLPALKRDTFRNNLPNQYFTIPYFFSDGIKAEIRSRGTGKTIVELFSEATSVRVCRNRSCNAEGFLLIILAASESFWLA